MLGLWGISHVGPSRPTNPAVAGTIVLTCSQHANALPNPGGHLLSNMAQAGIDSGSLITGTISQRVGGGSFIQYGHRWHHCLQRPPSPLCSQAGEFAKEALDMLFGDT